MLKVCKVLCRITSLIVMILLIAFFIKYGGGIYDLFAIGEEDIPIEIWLFLAAIIIPTIYCFSVDFGGKGSDFLKSTIGSFITTGTVLYVFEGEFSFVFRIVFSFMDTDNYYSIYLISWIVHTIVAFIGFITYMIVRPKSSVRYTSAGQWLCVCGRINEGIFMKCECGRSKIAGKGNENWNCPWCNTRNDEYTAYCSCGASREQAKYYYAYYANAQQYQQQPQQYQQYQQQQQAQQQQYGVPQNGNSGGNIQR